MQEVTLWQDCFVISGRIVNEGPSTELMIVVEPPHVATFWVPAKSELNLVSSCQKKKKMPRLELDLTMSISI
jgi:hypothetical protein